MANRRIGSGRLTIPEAAHLQFPEAAYGDASGHHPQQTTSNSSAPPRRGRGRGQHRQEAPGRNQHWRQQENPSYQPPHFRNPQFRGSGNQRPPNQTHDDGRSRNTRRFHVGFRLLEDWSNKESHIIIAQLIGQRLGFEEYLESDLKTDAVVLVVKILAKMCPSPFGANKTEIMSLASGDKFIGSLMKYIMQLQLQEARERRFNTFFWSDPDGFFNNLIVVFESLIETVPTRACEVLPKMIKLITLTMPNLETEQRLKISDAFKDKLQKLQEKLALCVAEMERKKKAVASNHEEEDPPDDFRQLSVYPSSQEILTSERAFVRKHIIEGPYDDVDHYLDVQFRLLKEDFVAPLRDGVSEFMKQEETHRRRKIHNVRIHPHVEFLSPRFGKDQVGVLLQFDFRTKTKGPPKNYAYSKRFMYGSLVCFVRDNFRTLLFGKILERDPSLLKQGQLVIGFDPGYDTYELNQPYMMVECSVYFEPYYHVLRALQNMHEDGFPMRNYLIDVNPMSEPPNYLHPDAVYSVDEKFVVPVNIPGAWPSADDLGLDGTQYTAFKAALTEKFVVIQGPPGTGKTFLGLEVAKTLIRNKQSWYNRTPILVVCFTNHALDQFLEGLTDTTKDIVRVGGQSKSNKLNAFNLREKRKSTQANRHTNNALYTLRKELGYQLSLIKNWSEGLDAIQRFQSVVRFTHFKKLDPDFANSWFATASDQAVGEWLFGGRTRQDRQQEAMNARLEEMQRQPQPNEEALNQDVDREMDQQYEAQNRAERNFDEDTDLLEMLLNDSNKTTHLFTVSDMVIKTNQIISDLRLLGDDVSEQAVFNKKWELERQLFEIQDDFNYLEMRMNEGRAARVTTRPVDLDLRQPHNMAPDDRWRLYFYWLHLYQARLINQLVAYQVEYRNKYRRYMEIKDIDDTEVMKQMLVVGMTTTGAARLQTTLQALQCRIVIVEEAAEVLESHIIVSLTNHCQHLILIGDHQQLRPSAASYHMEKYFNLGISLFERMVINKIQCHVLGVQHRMRPEIAKLIVPAIYPKLENHESVRNFDPIFGVDPFMYFIDHDQVEEESGDASKMNKHEAEFLIKLARYLVQNGYHPEDVTILTPYSGQMFALWRERKKYELLLRDVRITVLDNYQGEESKIILLSLVRSNADGQIGFLKTENRVCVALSRAKEGFYMMGNMDILCKNSQIWPKVRDVLESQECLGKSLALRCQIHREQVTRVQTAKDFQQVPEGGCNKVCSVELVCGHKCTRLCHIEDRAHETTKCKASCSKILCDHNHVCPKMCYEDCGPCQVLMKQILTCTHEHVVPCYMDPKDFKCPTLVTAKLPCGHTVTDKPCYRNVETYMCPMPCNTRVEPCGHACRRSCHIRDDADHLQYKCFKPCAKTREGCSTGEHACPKTCYEECPPCEMVVQKSRTICPHRFDVQCNKNVDDFYCSKPCRKPLPCGHTCKKKCSEPCGNCQEKVDKVLEGCWHTVKAKCSEPPSVKDCRGNCPRKLTCGHTCRSKCYLPCTAKCTELMDHLKPADCGHKFKIPCYMLREEIPSNSNRLLELCTEPCKATLGCRHRCSGTCGGCAQGRIHTSCGQKCGVILICGHQCPIPCRETCQPCNLKCSYRCTHSICKKKCGEPCTRCNEDCTRRCPHVRCDRKCGEVCAVAPCVEPCTKTLPCDHPCVGFCGDPCPPLCRLCDKEELTTVFLGFEDEPDARYVLLEECKHVIESEGMDGWLQQGGNEINYKSCPMCKTPLTSTQRYGDYIKRALKDVLDVKKRFFGSSKENATKQAQLLQKTEALITTNRPLLTYSADLDTLLDAFKKSLRPSRDRKRQPLNMLLAQTYTAKIQIVETITEIFNGGQLKNLNTIKKAVNHVNFLIKFLLRQEQRITNQEITDFHRELKRFERVVQLCQIEDCAQLKYAIAGMSTAKALYEQVNNLVFSATRYSDIAHASLKSKLTDLSEQIKSSIRITDKERREIVSAMGMSSGHWYKCPNGHIYAIGDCGEANQVSKCNECGATIGGQSHQLAVGNRHAGEMDGSRHAAW